MSTNIVSRTIEAAEKVLKVNPLLKIRYDLRNNEFLAAIDCLVIEALHSELLGKEDEIMTYSLSLHDLQKYCYTGANLGHLEAIYLQVEIGYDEGFQRDNQIVSEFRLVASLGDISWNDFCDRVKIVDKVINLKWFVEYLYALSKISNAVLQRFNQRIKELGEFEADAKIEAAKAQKAKAEINAKTK